jgi:hypothetical protein
VRTKQNQPAPNSYADRTGGPAKFTATATRCDVDDFCKDQRSIIAKALKHCGAYKENHPRQLILSEVMTILIYYHLSPYKNLTALYTRHVCTDLKKDFPDLVSYDRFVALIPGTLIPLMLYLADRCRRNLRTGIYYIDSPPGRLPP